MRLVPLGQALAHPPGAGGLRTTRLEVVLAGPRLSGPARLAYRDANYADRIGWKEIVVGAHTPSRSDELRAYPKDMLESPLDVTSASAELSPGSGADVAARALERHEPRRRPTGSPTPASPRSSASRT